MTTYDKIMPQLQQGHYAPVYLLCGAEAYYIDQVSDWLEEHVLDETAKAFDQVVIYGKDLPSDDVSPVISQARGMAMMGGKKVVILKEAQTVKKWEALALYMQNVQPDTILVICYKNGSPDKRLSLWKDFEKHGGVIMQSDKLKDYQMAAWIANYFKQILAERGLVLKVDPKVPELLAAYIGAEMNTVVAAIRKLIDGLPEGQTAIDTTLVERNIGISKDYNIFELEDALIAGDVLKANRITQYFAHSKDHAMARELAMLYSFFANLMLFHYLPDKSEYVAAKALGVAPFTIKNYAAAARRWNQMKTFRIIGYFRDTDARMKGINNVSAKEDALWQELIYKILH